MLNKVEQKTLLAYKDKKTQKEFINLIKGLVSEITFENALVPSLIDMWVKIFPFIVENYYDKVYILPPEVQTALVEDFYEKHKNKSYFDPLNEIWIKKYNSIFLTIKKGKNSKESKSFIVPQYLEVMGLPNVIQSTLQELITVSQIRTQAIITFKMFYDVLWLNYKNIVHHLTPTDVKILQYITNLQFTPTSYHLFHPSRLKRHLHTSKVWITQRFTWLHRRMIFWGLIFLNPNAFNFQTQLYEIDETFLKQNPHLLWISVVSPFNPKKYLLITRIPQEANFNPHTTDSASNHLKILKYGTFLGQIWFWYIIRNLSPLKSKGGWDTSHFKYNLKRNAVNLEKTHLSGHLIPLTGLFDLTQLPQTSESLDALITLAQVIDEKSTILGIQAPEDILMQDLQWSKAKVKYYIEYLIKNNALIMVPYFGCLGINDSFTLILKRKNADPIPLEDPLLYGSYANEMERFYQKVQINTSPNLIVFPKWQHPIIWVLQQLPQVSVWGNGELLIAHGLMHPTQSTFLKKWFQIFLTINADIIDGWLIPYRKPLFDLYNRHFLLYYKLDEEVQERYKQGTLSILKWKPKSC